MIPKKIRTNQDFVKYVMNFGPTGVLSELMVMQAIEQYAKKVEKAPIESLGPEDGFIDREAWQATAKYLVQSLKEFRGNPL